MLDRSELGGEDNDRPMSAPSPNGSSEPPAPPVPDPRLMATGLPAWDLEPPAVLIRRPGT